MSTIKPVSYDDRSILPSYGMYLQQGKEYQKQQYAKHAKHARVNTHYAIQKCAYFIGVCALQH